MAKYKVTARDWPPVSGFGHDIHPELRKQFGERDTVHDLTDAEVIAAMYCRSMPAPKNRLGK